MKTRFIYWAIFTAISMLSLVCGKSKHDRVSNKEDYYEVVEVVEPEFYDDSVYIIQDEIAVDDNDDAEPIKYPVYHKVAHKPSFSTVVDGDTAYFYIQGDGSLSLVEWRRHHDKKQRRLVIPSQVEHGGKTYTVTKIDDEAMGNEYYGDNESMAWMATFDNVKEIIVPNTVKSIGKGALSSRFSLFDCKIKLPETLEYIDDSAICAAALADSEGNVRLPKNLKHCGYMLGGEEDLNTLYIPSGLKEIDGLDEFVRGTASFLKVVVDKSNPYLKDIDGTLYSKSGDKIYWATAGTHLFVPKVLNITADDIEDLYEGWYANLGLGFDKITVEPGNRDCVVYAGNLYNKAENALLLYVDNGSELRVAPFCNKVIPTPLSFSTFVFDDTMDPVYMSQFLEFLTDVESPAMADEVTLTYLGCTQTVDNTDGGIAKFVDMVIAKNPSNPNAKRLKQLLAD